MKQKLLKQRMKKVIACLCAGALFLGVGAAGLGGVGIGRVAHAATSYTRMYHHRINVGFGRPNEDIAIGFDKVGVVFVPLNTDLNNRGISTEYRDWGGWATLERRSKLYRLGSEELTYTKEETTEHITQGGNGQPGNPSWQDTEYRTHYRSQLTYAWYRDRLVNYTFDTRDVDNKFDVAVDNDIASMYYADTFVDGKLAYAEMTPRGIIAGAYGRRGNSTVLDPEQNQAVFPGVTAPAGYKFVGWKQVSGNNAKLFQRGETLARSNLTVISFNQKETLDQYTGASLLAHDKDSSQPKVKSANFIDERITSNYNKWTVALQAKFEPISYGLNIVYDDPVTNPDKNISLAFGTDIQKTLNANKPVKREGFTFAGWSGVPADGKMPVNGLTVSAVWTRNSGNLILDYNDADSTLGTTKRVETTVAMYDDPLSSYFPQTTPTRYGHVFDGWDTGNRTTMPDGTYTITAKWIANKHSLKLDYNDGQRVPGLFDVPYNANVDEFLASQGLTAPVWKGHAFSYWQRTDENGGNYGDAKPVTMPNNAVELKAIWDTTTYVLTINYYSGKQEVFNVAYGTSINTVLEDSATRPGWIFAGWKTDAGQAVPDTMPNNNLTLMGNWTQKKFTLSVDKGDGSAPVVTPDLTYGTDLQNYLRAPTWGAYRFLGWKLASDRTVAAPTTMPDLMDGATLEIVASWNTQVSYITYDLAGGTTVLPLKTSYIYDDEPFNIPMPTKEGYDFNGWFDANGTQWTRIDTRVPLTETLALTARWTAKVYTLTLDNNDGSGGEATTQTVSYGDALDLPTPTRSGYDFVEWRGDDGEVYATGSLMPNKKLTLTAVWEIHRVKCTYDLGYAGAEVVEPTNHDANETVTLSVPTREGYTFLGWRAASDGQLYNGTYTLTDADVQFTAEWEVISYNLTLKNDDADIGTVTAYDYGATLNLTAPTKEGYTFLYWKDSLGNEYTGTTMPAGDMTLTAEWTVKRVSLTLDADDGTEPTVTEHDYNTDVNLTTPTKTGHTFLGWKAEGDSNLYTAFYTMGLTDVTLTAQWEVISYNLTLKNDDADIGTVTAYDYGATLNLTAPTKEGYDFVGWYTEGGVPNLSLTMPAGDMTLVAKWNEHSYELTTDFGNGLTEAKEYHVGGTVVTLDAQVRDGYTFLGWKEDGTDTMYNGTYTMPYRDVKLTAQWAETPKVTEEIPALTDLGQVTLPFGWAWKTPNQVLHTGTVTQIAVHESGAEANVSLTVVPIAAVEGTHYSVPTTAEIANYVANTKLGTVILGTNNKDAFGNVWAWVNGNEILANKNKAKYAAKPTLSADFLSVEAVGIEVRITDGDKPKNIVLDDTTDTKLLTLVDKDKVAIDNDNYVYDAANPKFLVNVALGDSLAALMAKFGDAASITVLDANGQAVADLTRGVRTGDKLRMLDGATIVDEVIIVVLGDINGDGKLTLMDQTQIFDYLDGIKLSPEKMLAANLNGDKVINLMDSISIYEYLDGASGIYDGMTVMGTTGPSEVP